jgi:hypothetical protein
VGLSPEEPAPTSWPDHCRPCTASECKVGRHTHTHTHTHPIATFHRHVELVTRQEPSHLTASAKLHGLESRKALSHLTLPPCSLSPMSPVAGMQPDCHSIRLRQGRCEGRMLRQGGEFAVEGFLGAIGAN